MEDNKLFATIAVAVLLGFMSLMAGMVRGCDNDAKLKIECIKAGKDPLACDKLGNH